jgi:hypothetical protein
VARYGFRPTKTRKNLLAQLYQVEEALRAQQDESEVGDVSIASTSSSFLHYSSMDLTSDADSVGDFSMDVIQQARDTSNPRGIDDAREKQQGSTRRIGVVDCDDDDDDDDGKIGHSDLDDDEEEDDDFSLSEVDRVVAEAEANAAKASLSSPSDIAPSLSNQLYQAITSDKSLYNRILLFEPVSFDEVSSTAKRAGVIGLRSKEVLRNWLDMQGICFYSAELTGQRQRY